MSLYHFSAQVIGRSSGRSSVACSSYRAGEKLKDERTGIEHDYTKKSGVYYNEIMLPKNAPLEYQDRQTLWNAVEEIEKGKNSQLAREINVALQSELSLEDNKKMLQEFVKENFVNAGMCADIAIHNPTPKEGEKENPHAHIMLSLRSINEKGEWESKAKFIYDLDKDGKKQYNPKNRQYKGHKEELTNWNKKETLEKWRENWAQTVNKEFERKNILERIDHRSLEAQGKEQIPTIHLGHIAHALEKKGVGTDRGNINREIKETNREFERLKSQLKEVEQEISRIKNGIETQETPKEKIEIVQSPSWFLNAPPEEIEKEMKTIFSNISDKETQLSKTYESIGEVSKQSYNLRESAVMLSNDFKQYYELSKQISQDKTTLDTEKEKSFFVRDRTLIKNMENEIPKREETRKEIIQHFEKKYNFSPYKAKNKVIEINSQRKEKIASLNIQEEKLQAKANILSQELKSLNAEYKEKILLVSIRPDNEKIQIKKEFRTAPNMKNISFNEQMERAKTKANLRNAPTEKEYTELMKKLEKSDPEIALKIGEKLKEITQDKIKDYGRER